MAERARELAGPGREEEIERAAAMMMQSRSEIEATVRAIRERLKVDHVKRVVSEMRRAARSPDTGRMGLVVASGIVLALVAAGILFYTRRGKPDAM